MAENLNYAYTDVLFDYNGNTSDSTSWCFGDDPANYAKYGRLYTWAAAMARNARRRPLSGASAPRGGTCQVMMNGKSCSRRRVAPM